MSVCIYIYLYREKSYTTGLAFIKYSSGASKGQSRIIRPQMNRNYSTMAKPTVFAVYSVARRREPIAIVPLQQPLCWHQIKQAQGSAVSLLVPQVQQTRNASPLWLVSDLNCFPYAPDGIYDPAGAQPFAPHFSGSSAGRFCAALICEKAGSSQPQPALCGSRFTATGALDLILKGLKSASFMFLRIIICWGSLQNLNLLSALQTQLRRWMSACETLIRTAKAKGFSEALVSLPASGQLPLQT